MIIKGGSWCKAMVTMTFILTIHVTPQVLGSHLTLALHEPKHHFFIYEHGTYVMH
jgi:hypothetical protein